MLRRLLTTLFVVVAVAGFAQVASAQYMYLDSNANGVHDAGDQMQANGTPTTVDVWLDTNSNRDGSDAFCNDGGSPLNMLSYVVWLQIQNGTGTYAGFINQQPAFAAARFGPINTGNGFYSDGFGGSVSNLLAPGLYRLMTIQVTGTGGTPNLIITDNGPGGANITSFGGNCLGNDFDNTYKLVGPTGVGTDWTDTDGLAAAPGAVNNPPVLGAIGNLTTAELVALAFTATATDPDAGQTRSFTLDAGAPAGAAINASTGAFSWTPTEAQGPGVFPITVRVTDNGTPTRDDFEAISVNVTEANLAPVLAGIGPRTGTAGTPVTFTATATDADIPANTLAFSIEAGATTAGATINATTGAFSWTPAAAGSFSATIRVTDNGSPVLFDNEAIAFTISAAANVAPVLGAIGNRTIAELATLAFTATATDANAGQTLTFSLGAGAPTGAAINGSTGAFSWTPTEAQGPAATPITVIVTDNGTPTLNDTELITVTVTEVNVAPVLGAIGNRTIAELATLAFTATATDADVPANTLTWSLGAGAPAGATINGGGAFSWTPTEAQGPASTPITIIVTDNGTPALNDTELITVTVTEVNVAPVLGAIGNRTIAELATLAFTATATDADLPANTLTFSLGAGAPTGAAINGTTGAFSWTPTEAQGPASTPITVVVTDNGTPALNDTELITVTVTEVNAAPVLGAIGNRTIAELATLAFTATATDPDVPANTLTFTLGAGAPAGAAINATTGAFSWTPTEAQGPASTPITVVVTDNGTPTLNDTELITVTVTEVNVAPVLAGIGAKTGTVGVPITFTATATDADVPANTLTFSLEAGAPAGATINGTTGAFSWTPAANGTFSATVRVTDNGTPALFDNEAVAFTISAAPNVAPVLGAIGNRTIAELVALTFTATATDANSGDVLTFSLDAGAPAGATIGGTTGAFSWTPTEAQGPAATPITVRVTDNGTPALSDFETITVTVTEVNVAPVLGAIGNRTIAELATLAFTATATDADVPANTLTWSLGAGAPTGAAINGGGAFSWTPTEAQGPASTPITIIVTDNGTPALNDTELITVTVTEVNVAPVLGAIGNRTIAELATLAFTATATDADLPANTLTFSLGAGAPTGAAINGTTGAFSWTPTEAQGPASTPITVVVTDNGTPALNDTELITVTVTEVNAAPVLGAIGNRTIAELATLAFTATATDPDVPANTLTFTLGAGAPAGAAINATTGAFSWTPTETNGPGSFPITVVVTDNGTPVLNDTELITVTVTEVNVAPVLAGIGAKTGTVGVAITFTATATDADIPANTLTFSLDAGAPAGATIGAATGAFTWTPSTNGSFSATVRVTDNGTPALSDFEAVAFTISAAPNQAPVLGAIGNRTVAELATLAFTATATDPDAGQTRTFSLDAGNPAGSTINGTTGAFSWTPTEAQGPASTPITVRVTDNGSPALSDFETITVTVTEVNAAPVLGAIGNRTIAELATLAFTATATDADVPANTLTWSLGAGAPAGAAINGGGAFSWTPTEAQGPASTPITIIVTDNGTPALNDTELITVTVTEVNVAPVLGAIGNRTIAELATLAFTATATDADLPANTLTFSLGAGAPTGAAINGTTGAFSWTPTEAQGPASTPITVVVTDNGTPALNDTELITVTVTEVNVAPVLGAIGNRTVAELATLAFTATATDADVPANTLTFTLGAGAPAGAAINATTGAFSWTPTETNGPGSFPITVVVTDNGTPVLNDTEAITVTVTEVNVAPVLAGIGPKTGSVGVAVTFTATATDADIPANTLTFSLDAGAPAGATIGAATGAFTWTPSTNGTFSATVRVTDNGTPALSDFEAVAFTISAAPNQAPVLGAIGNRTVAELATLAFTATATDPNAGQTLTFSLDAGNPAGSTINGTTGAFSWTPTEAQGPAATPITVRVTDNGSPALSDFETITVTVTEVNVAPVLGAIGNRTIAELATLAFTATATDADVPANTLTWSLGAGAPAGATINGGGAFSWTPTETNGPGSFPITIIVTDNGTPVLNDSELITVTVTEVNVAPVLGSIGNRTVAELATLAFTATATDADLPANTLTFSLGAGAPAGATIGGASGAFSWTPTEAQGPAATPITIVVTDNGTPALNDTELITVTVTEVNVAPVLGAIGNRTIAELATLAFTATATDADLPANTLTFSLGAGAPAGATIGGASGAFSWTPTEAQGPASTPITIVVTDNGTPALNDSELITVTVTEVNVAPVLGAVGNKSGTVGVAVTFTATATDADIPANTLTFSLDAGAPAGATIGAATGAFSFTPTANGTFPVTVRVTDNGTPALSDFEAITITVSAAPNQAPVLGAIGNKTVAELATLAFTATATDPDAGSVLTFSLDAPSPAGATINGSTGAFSWTPTEAQGPAAIPITVRVTDNGSPALSDFETIAVAVTEVNGAPVLGAIGNKTVNELSALTFTATATDADVPANSFSFSLDAPAPAGAAINATTGAFSWTPTEVQGPAIIPITVRVTDSGSPALSDFETIAVAILEVNVAPVLANITDKSVTQGALVAFTATATDADIPANTLTFSLDAGAPAGAAITAGGAFSWTPSASGSFPITVRVTDNGSPALDDSQTFTVNVGAVNAAPVLAQPSDMTVNEGATADQQLTATDPDAGDVLTFNKVSGPAFMTVSASGNVHLAPGSSDAGVYPATVRVSDNGTPSLSDSKSFQITVIDANNAPTANAGGPYTGSVGTPVNFNGSGSSDPDGDVLTFAWDFGDASTGTGATPSHPYAAIGVYTVTLVVTDTGMLSDDATTTATISDFLAANVFYKHNLNYIFPQILGTWIRMEPIDGNFNVNDVLLSTLTLTYNGVTIASTCKNIIDGDSNGNGVTEIRACFAKNEVKPLFASLPNGTTTVTLTLEANLLSGGRVRGNTTARVVKFSWLHAGQMAAVSPNPLNPQGTLNFVTTKPGAASVMVFDPQGRLVRNLMQRQYLLPGPHAVTVDGRNENGNALATGVYYYRVQSADGVMKGSFIVMK